MINFFINFLLFLFVLIKEDIPYRIKHRKEWHGYGCKIYTGLPGTGKTMAMSEYAMRIHKRYPDVPIYSNYNLKIQTAPINSWEDLVNYPEGLFLIDEIQLTFNSRDWKDFPYEMVTLLTQNRKLHKELICTTQEFGLVDKTFRTLTNYVVECSTLGGRWTFCKAFYTSDYVLNAEKKDNGIRKRHRAWRYNFVQDKHIRESYDTMLRLESLKNTQFISGEERAIRNSGSGDSNIIVINKGKGKH